MTNVRALLAVSFILVFGAGLAGGYVGASTARPSSGMTYLERLATDYHLRPEQVDRIRGLLADEERKVDDVLNGIEDPVKEAIRAARAETVEKIRGELDAAQQIRFDQDRKRGG